MRYLLIVVSIVLMGQQGVQAATPASAPVCRQVQVDIGWTSSTLTSCGGYIFSHPENVVGMAVVVSLNQTTRMDPILKNWRVFRETDVVIPPDDKQFWFWTFHDRLEGVHQSPILGIVGKHIPGIREALKNAPEVEYSNLPPRFRFFLESRAKK